MGLFLQNVAPVYSDMDARSLELLAMKNQIVGFFPSSFFVGVATASSPILKRAQRKQKLTFSRELLIFFGARDGT